MSSRPIRARPFVAETVAIGSELLMGGRSDSNSLFVAEALGSLGIEVRFKSTVGDDRLDIITVLKTATHRARVIVMTGGLGPTVDDCTREAISAMTLRRLCRRKDAVDGMTARLAQWGRTPNKGQLQQAMIPWGALLLPNPVGSAPGFLLSWKGATLIALPGVPREMKSIMKQTVIPLLADQLRQSQRALPPPIRRVLFHTWGLLEADVDDKLKGVFSTKTPVNLGLLASPMGVMVSLTTTPYHPVTEEIFTAIAEEVRDRLSQWLYAEGCDTMESVVGRLLAKQELTIAVAESCTGGLIGHRLTQVPGSSVYVDRGVICYSNRAKKEMLGVPCELIARYGAVSHEVGAAMARGVRGRAGVSVGLSVTGIAGPGGGTATKPVGLVYVSLDGGAHETITEEFCFQGDRAVIKQRSSQAALDLLRRWLIGRSDK